MCFGPSAWGVRKIYAHVRHLGPDSALAAHHDAKWSPELELMATLVELEHASFRAFVAANAGKSVTLPPPLKIPRPEGILPKGPPPATATLDSVRSIFLGGESRDEAG